jgi:hypothetical protein
MTNCEANCKGSIIIGSACGKCERCKEEVQRLLEKGWISQLVRDIRELRLAENANSNAAIANDIRDAGWSVAVHNDYLMNGERFTFWLFTHRNGKWVKGEGRNDAEALNAVRMALKVMV